MWRESGCGEIDVTGEFVMDGERLAGGLKQEVERLRALLHEAWLSADKGEIDGVDLGWVAKCDKLFASAASEPKELTP